MFTRCINSLCIGIVTKCLLTCPASVSFVAFKLYEVYPIGHILQYRNVRQYLETGLLHSLETNDKFTGVTTVGRLYQF